MLQGKVALVTGGSRGIGAAIVKRLAREGTHVALSKSALQGMVQGFARDLGPRGITINNVQPGPIDSELNPDQGDFAESLKKVTALPRYGTADEVAAMVAYPTGPEAGYVTGAHLMIDGGFSA